MNNAKSSTLAGLLGIFLGAVGAHDFYLGGARTKKGIIHVCLFATGLIVEVLASAILPNTLSPFILFRTPWLFIILNFIATGCMSASAIWGFIDGIRILSKGDTGLLAEGYAVSQPVMQQHNQPQYGQPLQQQIQQSGQQSMQQLGQNQPTQETNDSATPTQMG